MEETSTKTQADGTALFAGDAWFDPIEAGIRERVRGFIEELIGQELEAALGRGRYERDAETPIGYRNGTRERHLLGSFGLVEISVPRARMAAEGGGTQEWRSAALPRYARMTRQVEALIAGGYLAGTNTRRVKRALAALFGGAVGKDVVTVTLAACWSHARRKFYELHNAGSPVASEALARIAALYAIEADIRGQPSEERQRVRAQQSRPLVEALKLWLELKLAHLPGRSRLAEAIRYALNRWSGLSQFLDDGRIDLDTNPVERSIRPVALGRKNALFAGSDGGARRWAVVGSLVETAKLNGVEPYAWLRDVLNRMVDGHPQQCLDELLPWNQAKTLN